MSCSKCGDESFDAEKERLGIMPICQPEFLEDLRRVNRLGLVHSRGHPGHPSCMARIMEAGIAARGGSGHTKHAPLVISRANPGVLE